ncbi:MAG TPA: FecR domain-containing protein [Spirochaetota bacterium]|nr:FecR domain-containing protein [Spirochaetota bacterium]
MGKIYIVAAAAALLMFSADSYSAITVESVEGKVAYKDGGAWRPLARNQALREGTRISTGVASSAVIKIDNATVTVRPMSMMGITRNMVKDGISSTNLGLKYGGVNARVAKIKNIRTNFKISTPIATSSVRGTEEEVTYGPRSGMVVKVIAGLVKLENPNGVSTTVGKFQKFQLKRGNPRPQSLLSGLRGGSMINVMPDDITETERDFFEFFGEELGNNPGDEGLIFEQFPSAKINARIVFPAP